MSMTKDHIGTLQNRAAAGDLAAIGELSSAGLWESVEEHQARIAWDAADRFDETDEAEDEGAEFDEPDGEPFDDAFADGEALASAGFGTDEDYGFFGGDEY